MLIMKYLKRELFLELMKVVTIISVQMIMYKPWSKELMFIKKILCQLLNIIKKKVF